MRMLVTGGGGYCGVPLCARLLADGHDVTIVDNFMFGHEAILHLVTQPSLQVVVRDIRHPDLSYVKNQDVVFHLAGLSGYPACEANAHSACDINVEATRRLAAALSPAQLLVFPSTTSFYGSSGDVGSEDSTPTPVSLYGRTKWQAEQAVMERPNSIALRWATVFGVSPRMRFDLLVNDLVERAVHERVMVLYDADSRRTFIHIDDVVRGYVFALEHRDLMAGRVLNVGSNELNHSKREIALRVQHYCGGDVREADGGDRDVRDFRVSFDRIGSLGFRCTKTLDDGIGELAKLARLSPRWSPIRPI